MIPMDNTVYLWKIPAKHYKRDTKVWLFIEKIFGFETHLNIDISLLESTPASPDIIQIHLDLPRTWFQRITCIGLCHVEFL